MKTVQLFDSLAAETDPLFDHDAHQPASLHEELRELGLSDGELAEVEDVLQRHVRDEAVRLAAEAFAQIIARLAETQKGAELRAALGLGTASFTDIASRWGCTKQAMNQGTARLTEALGRFTLKKRQPKKPTFSPPTEAHERKCVAARRWAGTEAAVRDGRLAAVKHRGRVYVLRDAVDQLKAEAELAAAEARLREAPAAHVDDLNKVQ